MLHNTAFACLRGLVYRLPVSLRLLRTILLLALMLAPFGRMGIAEAKAAPHHGMAMMASHCPGQSGPDGDKSGGMSVDCMIACAAMVPAPAALLVPPPSVETAVIAVSLPIPSGIRPEAEPPPPRLS